MAGSAKGARRRIGALLRWRAYRCRRSPPTPDRSGFHRTYPTGHIDSQLNASVHSGHRTMTTATEHRYIVRDDGILGGEPIVTGTRTPVRAIVETWRGARPR